MAATGLIGAGVMGLTAAERIIKAGHPLRVFDVNPEALEKARRLGAIVGAAPAEVAAEAEAILMFLPGPKEVELCTNGPDGLLTTAREGMVIVDHSTVDPGVTRAMAKAALAKGVGYLDAPVLGRPASVGHWALPVGGNEKHLSQCRPILKLVASKILHVGPIGAGNQIKLLNQLMFGAINAMTAEMMAIAAKMGIEPRLLCETITASQAGTVSNLFKELGARIAAEDYSDPTFTVELLVKDVRLAVQMAKDNQAPPLLARTIEFINEMAGAQGLEDSDTAVMWKSYQKIWEKPI